MIIEVFHMGKGVCKVKRLIADRGFIRCTLNIIIKGNDTGYRSDSQSHTPTCRFDLAGPRELHRYRVCAYLEINVLPRVEVVLVNTMHSFPMIAFCSDILTIECDYHLYIGILFINLPRIDSNLCWLQYFKMKIGCSISYHLKVNNLIWNELSRVVCFKEGFFNLI